MNSLQDCFKNLTDPRVVNRCLHPLDEVLFIAFCTLVSNGEDYQDMVDFAEARQDWLRNYIDLPNGVPSYDTFRRVFQLLDPNELKKFLAEDAAPLLAHIEDSLISLDGKKLRGESPKSKGNKGFFLLHAWVNEHRLCIGQKVVGDKSNEITAIPELLEELPLTGATVRIDAMGCQREIAEKIVEKEGNYLLSLKANQPTLLEFASQEEFWRVSPKGCTSLEKGHGRQERRTCRVLPADTLCPPAVGAPWKDLESIIRVDSRRQVGDKVEENTRYYISNQKLDADSFAAMVRAHWGVENQLHWHLDVTFNEDACRVRTGHAAENLAILRRVALQRVRQLESKSSLKKRRFKAALNTDFLEKILKL